MRKAIFEDILYWCGMQDIMINPQQSTGTDIGTGGYVFHCDLFSCWPNIPRRSEAAAKEFCSMNQ